MSQEERDLCYKNSEFDRELHKDKYADNTPETPRKPRRDIFGKPMSDPEDGNINWDR